MYKLWIHVCSCFQKRRNKSFTQLSVTWPHFGPKQSKTPHAHPEFDSQWNREKNMKLGCIAQWRKLKAGTPLSKNRVSFISTGFITDNVPYCILKHTINHASDYEFRWTLPSSNGFCVFSLCYKLKKKERPVITKQ